MSLGVNAQQASNLNSLNNLTKAKFGKSSALEKLSSGLRINRGSDDPSGLLISELLRSQIGGYERALRNTQETNNLLGIAEGGLSGMSAMLNKMRGLAIHALNSGLTSGAQVNADQGELNSLLSTMQRVSDTTSYAGKNLLNGANSFTFETRDPSGLLDSSLSSISSLSGLASNSLSVTFAGGAEAQAEKAHIEGKFGGSTLGTAQEFTLTGNAGSRTFSFAAGTGVADMAAQINNLAGSTGVNAYAIDDKGAGPTSIRLVSTEYGADARVDLVQHAGSAFAETGGRAQDYGRNAVVQVNGAPTTVNGLTANVAGGDVAAKLTFKAGDAEATTIAQTGYDKDDLVDAAAARSASLANVSGGMRLQLAEGPGGQGRENISIGNYQPAALGQVAQDGKTYSLNDLYGGGSASLSANPELALKVINQAISDVAAGRAGIGAYQANALESNANNLMVAIENVTATESSIRDADMAEAMTMFIKNKLLENANLKTLHNSRLNSNNVLQLLGGPGSR